MSTLAGLVMFVSRPGLPPVAVVGVGLGMVGAGLLVLRAEAAAQRPVHARADALEAAAGEDAWRSPVPWIADAVWAEANRDYYYRIALAEHLGHQATDGEDDWPVRPVDEAHRARAVPAPVTGLPVPPPGPPEEQARRLGATPGEVPLAAGEWPLCCERLCSLLCYRGDTSFERAGDSTWICLPDGQEHEAAVVVEGGAVYLAEPDGTRTRDAVHGLVGYQCRACGRRYAAAHDMD